MRHFMQNGGKKKEIQPNSFRTLTRIHENVKEEIERTNFS